MKEVFQSAKVIELGSCAFRQWRATSHCRFLHGYQLKAKLWFGCSELDNKGWVVDFGSLKALKDELKSIYDHTTTVALDDPELETFKKLHDSGIIQLYIVRRGVGVERTAEYVFEIAQRHIDSITNGRCWVDKVEVFEHDENSAIFSNDQHKYNTTAGLNYNKNPLVGVVNTGVVGEAITQTINTSSIAPVGFTGAAHVGPSNVSNGMGNPFAGTSWGA